MPAGNNARNAAAIAGGGRNDARSRASPEVRASARLNAHRAKLRRSTGVTEGGVPAPQLTANGQPHCPLRLPTAQLRPPGRLPARFVAVRAVVPARRAVGHAVEAVEYARKLRRLKTENAQAIDGQPSPPRPANRAGLPQNRPPRDRRSAPVECWQYRRR